MFVKQEHHRIKSLYEQDCWCSKYQNDTHNSGSSKKQKKQQQKKDVKAKKPAQRTAIHRQVDKDSEDESESEIEKRRVFNARLHTCTQTYVQRP